MMGITRFRRAAAILLAFLLSINVVKVPETVLYVHAIALESIGHKSAAKEKEELTEKLKKESDSELKEDTENKEDLRGESDEENKTEQEIDSGKENGTVQTEGQRNESKPDQTGDSEEESKTSQAGDMDNESKSGQTEHGDESKRGQAEEQPNEGRTGRTGNSEKDNTIEKEKSADTESKADQTEQSEREHNIEQEKDRKADKVSSANIDTEHTKEIREGSIPDIAAFEVDEGDISSKAGSIWYAKYDPSSESSRIHLSIEVDSDSVASVRINANQGEEIIECEKSDDNNIYTAEFSKDGIWTFQAEVTDLQGNISTALFGSGEYQEGISIVISDTQPRLKVTYEAEPYKKDGESGQNIYYNKENESVILELSDELEQYIEAKKRKKPEIHWVSKDKDLTVPDGQETETASQYIAKYNLSEEGDYTFRVSYHARNGRSLEISEQYPGSWTRVHSDQEGYESRTVVVDHTPPVMTRLVLEEGNNRRIKNDGKENLYLNNITKEEASMQFIIADEHLAVSSLKVCSEDLKHELPVETLGDTKQGQEFKSSFRIDDWEKEGSYSLQLRHVKDKAGNALVIQETERNLLNTVRIVIDRTAPVLKINYPEAKTIIADSERMADNRNELFYTRHEPVGFELAESNYIPGVSDKDFNIVIKSKDTDETEDYEILDGKSEGPELEEGRIKNAGSGQIKVVQSGENSDQWRYVLDDLPETDSHSFFTVSYTDFSGNPLTEVTEQMEGKPAYEPAGIIKHAGKPVYVSPVITVDGTAPVIKTSFDGKAESFYKDRRYYQEAQTMTVTVTDENFNCRTGDETYFSITYSAYDYDDHREDIEKESFPISWKKGVTWDQGEYVDGKKQFTGTVEVGDEWNYDIETKGTDLAGNRAGVISDYITIDKSKPYISIQDMENTPESDVLFFSNHKYRIPADFFDYKTYGYFHNSLMKVKITAHDMISGVYKVKYVVRHKDKSITRGEWIFDSPGGNRTKYLTIPKNAKDCIEIIPVDYASHVGERATPRGAISETENYHKSNSSIKLLVNTRTANIHGGIRYFNSSVDAKIIMEDQHSGIRNYDYSAGAVLAASYDYSQEAGSVDRKGNPQTEVVCQKVLHLRMEAGDINYSSAQSPTMIRASFTDHAGHGSRLEEKIVIDDKKPVIEVNWSSQVEPMNSKYYRDTRTAVITVHERNFDENGVKWKINSMTGVEISAWSHRGDSHTCSVAFTEDGDDFVLDFDVTDLAKNSSSCPSQDPFTIDKTAPVLSLDFDNHRASNGHYYNKARTAYLHIEEHNFRESDVTYEMSAVCDGKSIHSPAVSGWSEDGDRHAASAEYNRDGDFSLGFAYTDLAGNPANKIITEKFTIDLTKPEVIITGVRDHNAYKGKVAPGIEYSDINLDRDCVSIRLVGNKTGETDYERYEEDNSHGTRIRWKDFRRIQEIDDIYTFEVIVKDKAGNVNDTAKTVFSVNRFGSNYLYSSRTKGLAASGHPYLREPIPIEVTEVNASGLKERSVSVRNENNEIFDLKEGMDYTVTESKDHYGWMQYSYVIDASNFANEGQYSVTLSSLDEASNRMTSMAKDMNIDFVIDRTKPTGSISGLEEARYVEDKHQIFVRADDNYGLKEAVLYVDGVVKKRYKEEDFQSGYALTETLRGKKTIQRVSLKVADWAGNSVNIFPDGNVHGSLITSDRWVQFYHNKPLFYGLVSAGLVLISGIIALLTGGFGYEKSMAGQAGIWWLLSGKQKKSKKE